VLHWFATGRSCCLVLGNVHVEALETIAAHYRFVRSNVDTSACIGAEGASSEAVNSPGFVFFIWKSVLSVIYLPAVWTGHHTCLERVNRASACCLGSWAHSQRDSWM
jgi:hypothetical protein